MEREEEELDAGHAEGRGSNRGDDVFEHPCDRESEGGVLAVRAGQEKPGNVGPYEKGRVEWWIRDTSNYNEYLQVLGHETAPFRRCTTDEINAKREDDGSRKSDS
jgi:hypothetical protein